MPMADCTAAAPLAKMIAEEARRRGKPAEATNTDQIFAIDTATGEFVWIHQGKAFRIRRSRSRTACLYFVDSSLTPPTARRSAAAGQDRTGIADRRSASTGRRADQTDRRSTAVALDAATGDVVWSKPVDVTDCTGVGIGAGLLTLMVVGRSRRPLWCERQRTLLGSSSWPANSTSSAGRAVGGDRREALGTRRQLSPPSDHRRQSPRSGTVGVRIDTGEQLMRTHPLTGHADTLEVYTSGPSLRRNLGHAEFDVLPIRVHRILRFRNRTKVQIISPAIDSVAGSTRSRPTVWS